jgi:long-chain fatty acid transport protein
MSLRSLRSAASILAVAGALGGALASAGAANAAAFSLQEQSTRAAGRAFSGEAADRGVESLWWNPAAIAGTDAEAYTSATGIFPSSDVNNQGSTITYPGGTTVPVGGAGHASNPIFDGLIAAGGMSHPIGDRFNIGLSVAAPYNFITKYKSDSFARYEGLKTRLYTGDIQLTGAWRVTRWLDLGVGVDAVYTSSNLNTASPNLAPGAPDGVNSLRGDGWAGGYVVGAQFHPTNRFDIGLSYRSAVKHDLSGDVTVAGLGGPLAGADTTTHGKANFKTPWTATLGGRFKVNDRLTLDAQVQRIGWSEFSAINISYPGVAQVLPQNYHDTTTAAFGADYKVTPRLTLRAGAQWDPTPTPDHGRTVRVPDSDRWLFAGGGSYQVSKHLTLEGAVEYVDFLGSKVNSAAVFYGGTPAQTTADYFADVSGSAVVISGGMHWRF